MVSQHDVWKTRTWCRECSVLGDSHHQVGSHALPWSRMSPKLTMRFGPNRGHCSDILTISFRETLSQHPKTCCQTQSTSCVNMDPRIACIMFPMLIVELWHDCHFHVQYGESWSWGSMIKHRNFPHVHHLRTIGIIRASGIAKSSQSLIINVLDCISSRSCGNCPNLLVKSKVSSVGLWQLQEDAAQVEANAKATANGVFAMLSILL